MVEALKKDKFLSELPKEGFEMSNVDITDNALTSKDGEILRLLNQIASDLLTNSCNLKRTIDNFMPHLWRKQP